MLRRARTRRYQAEKATEAIAMLRDLHAGPESIAKIDRIRAEALQLAQQYEAGSHQRAESISCLPEPARAVVRLYWVDGFTFREIAENLHYSESYVHQIHSKAIKDIDSGKVFLSGMRAESEAECQ